MIGSKAGCAACHGEIFGAPVKLGSVSYHQKCFICCTCKARLQMSTYAMNKEQLYCPTCYRNVCLRNVDTKSDGALGLTGAAVPPTATAAAAPAKPKLHDSSRQLQKQYASTPPPPPTTAAPEPPTAVIPPGARQWCHVCGAKVEVAGAKFCLQCGTKFE